MQPARFWWKGLVKTLVILREFDLGATSRAFRILKRLAQSGYVTKANSRCEIDDPFFKMWIKQRRKALEKLRYFYLVIATLTNLYAHMPDFTISIYRQLLSALQGAGYRFITFEEYMRKTEVASRKTEDGSRKPEVHIADSGLQSDHTSPVTHHPSPQIILRHDVDLLPQNSLTFARIQHKMGIVGSYYFRAVPESLDEDIIKEIHSLGHEVGYHYEDMDKVNSEKIKVKSDDFPVPSEAGNVRVKTPSGSRTPTSGLQSDHPSPVTHHQIIDLAIRSFAENLEKLRRLVPVSTICMHGSPRSRFDNRDLWKKYDYRDYGIIGEPYFDVDFDEMFYLTDTGRRWDGWKVSIRDKMPQQQEWIKQGLVFRSTQKIIEQVKRFESEKREAVHEAFPSSGGSGNFRIEFPSRLMMTFHPQRWTDKPVPWLKEWVLQSAKNRVKYLINLRRENQ